MYVLIRRNDRLIEILKDPIDRRERVFLQEEEAMKYADKLNLHLHSGPKWEVQEY
ncbi:hypothetical protein SAMN05192559_11145 [Halobacillus karajensis]|uniref:Uncharacterized protein n=1 Tax=Halobacillus karajensis TaxID=195088 RepID=A0A024P9F5_9BACI|nr:hypothetical protein [Halobacillus karajensis]CDQ21554.1 hypothetical protein BN982_03956 [Halobacillus karajensis]CDQ25488.1 hypothetical protein BN983_03834 [Halobacillus karajensis]CDQ28981.1 hypothetical protein BN981_03325 [Halobacillus karajensis]SEI09038.1 hypothetical protein SAMN05192559_11145 [Halobacillus karajensis]